VRKEKFLLTFPSFCGGKDVWADEWYMIIEVRNTIPNIVKVMLFAFFMGFVLMLRMEA